MDVNSLLTKWVWILFIGVTFANAWIFRSRANERIKGHPELEDGYRRLIKGFVLWGNLPWVVMGLGILVGKVPTVSAYFHPQDRNPFVLAFWASLVVLWAVGTHWIFLRGGAEMLVRHPGLANVDFKSPRSVKTFWCLGLLGGIVTTVIVFVGVFPAPK